MPQKSNIVGDLGTTKVASDSYDVDNIYLSEEGWVYRHYKKADKSKWWDEIIVAGEVPAGDSPEATNPPKLGTAAAPTFESGDSIKDFEYSPLYGNTATGGGVPNFNGGGDAGPPAVTIGIATLSGNDDPTEGTTETYTVSWDGTIEDPTITWQILSGSGNILSGQGTTSVEVEFTGTSAVQLAVAVTSEEATDSPRGAGMELFITAAFSTLVANADLSVAVTVADTGNGDKYQINGVEQDAIVASVGTAIHFDLSDASLSGHPLKIYTDSSKTTEVTVGVTQEGTDLIFAPPIAGNFSYQCGNHANMGGDITVS